MSTGGIEERRWTLLAFAGLAAAMAIAAALLLWEGRGLTFFVDEWSFGFGDRTGLDPAEILAPENGHLAVIPVLITKASLELFGADTALPLRIVSVALHLTTAGLLFGLLRKAVGDLVALAPAILVLFVGSASDLLIGSHGMPMLIAVSCGLGAWLALGTGSGRGDALAALLLAVGLASNGLTLPFVVGAAAILLAARDPRWRRLWVVAAPLALYLAWRLAYGDGDGSDFAFANLAALPAFAFDSLGAELAAVTGLFTAPGVRAESFDDQAGLALAGALLVALAAGYLAAGWRPPRAALPAAVGLIALWLLTGAVASPARQPESARYLYPGAILLLLIAAQLLAASPWRRRGSLVLIAVCAIGLLPNLRELHYAGAFFREQSDQDKAVLAAADLLGTAAPADLPLEQFGDPSGIGVQDLGFTLERYRRSRERYGTPAFSPRELEGAVPIAREAADRLLGRGLGSALAPTAAPPRALPPRIEASAEGGEVRGRAGCLLFRPLAAPAQLVVAVPSSGLWLHPAPGPAVPVALGRFADGFPVGAGSIPGGSSSALAIGPGAAAEGWRALLTPSQPVRVCGV